MIEDNPCPVKPPKLLKAESLVTVCASCGTWVERCPAFFGELDGYWQCDKCGNTSVKIRDGRPYGAKSREWGRIVQEFEELCFDIPFWEWETITTEPPMKDLDWKAVETWYRSRGIHRMFIAGGEILEFKAEEE